MNTLRKHTLALFGAVSTLLLVASTASAQPTIADLLAAEDFAADFNLEPPGSTFEGLPGARFEGGVVQFIQAPAFYLTGSNRAWGIQGPGKATIVFSQGVESVTLVARGSAAGDAQGPNFGNAPLSEAIGTITAFGSGTRRRATVPVQNVSVRTPDATVIRITAESIGARRGIRRIELDNFAAADNALVLINGIGFSELDR